MNESDKAVSDNKDLISKHLKNIAERTARSFKVKRATKRVIHPLSEAESRVN